MQLYYIHCGRYCNRTDEVTGLIKEKHRNNWAQCCFCSTGKSGLSRFWRLDQSEVSIADSTTLKHHSSQLLELKVSGLFPCLLFYFAPPSPFQMLKTEGSCEAGALRRGPKKECRDSMIHKAELFNGWMHVEHSAPAEPGSPKNRCRLNGEPQCNYSTQHV